MWSPLPWSVAPTPAPTVACYIPVNVKARCVPRPVDVALVVDASSSMLKGAGDGGTVVGEVTFGQQAAGIRRVQRRGDGDAEQHGRQDTRRHQSSRTARSAFTPVAARPLNAAVSPAAATSTIASTPSCSHGTARSMLQLKDWRFTT